MKHDLSNEWLSRGERLIPGGVNSPVRAFKAVGGNPPFITGARGSRISDVDGNSYIDYVGSWGPAILGHAHPAVISRVKAAVDGGLSFGAPTTLEVEFAQAINARYPSMEMLRCVSSGTEATMSALRVARGFTGRDVIVKFDGAYHGHADALLVKAGSGAATFGAPDSAGVPAKMVENTVTSGYNDTSALSKLFEREGSRIAAVIVEPVAGNMGCVPPKAGFLEAIIELCSMHGAVSIFDEVMTGCRLAAGGAQGRFGLKPDMTCLGKVVGGGMPLAVYGGRREIMSKISPLGPVYQAGTLSGNPLAVTAGLATIELLNDAAYERLEQAGTFLEKELKRAVEATRTAAVVQRVGSMLTLFFNPEPVTCWTESSQSDIAKFGAWHRALLERGVYWPAAQFEAAFISTAHSDADLEETARTARAALEAL